LVLLLLIVYEWIFHVDVKAKGKEVFLLKKSVSSFLLIVFAASAAYAAYGTTDASNGQTVGTAPNHTMVTSSKNVFVEYIAETTVGGQGYVLGAYHSGGTMTFATSAGDTKTYRQDGTGRAVPAVAPVGTATVDFTGNGWTMM
jgi:hypothetical protein